MDRGGKACDVWGRREKGVMRLEHRVNEAEGLEIDSQIGLYKTEGALTVGQRDLLA